MRRFRQIFGVARSKSRNGTRRTHGHRTRDTQLLPNIFKMSALERGCACAREYGCSQVRPAACRNPLRSQDSSFSAPHSSLHPPRPTHLEQQRIPCPAPHEHPKKIETPPPPPLPPFLHLKSLSQILFMSSCTPNMPRAAEGTVSAAAWA